MIHKPLNILVTGGTAGIGFETARELGLKGHKVFFTGRQLSKGATQEALWRGQGMDVSFIQADLSTQNGVVNLARLFMQKAQTLDRLINNVGGVFPNRQINSDGLENTFAMNLLHPLLLASCLFPILEPCHGRVIQITTGYHLMVHLTQRDKLGKRWDSGMNVYGRAKLMALWAGRALGQRWKSSGVGIHFADPGMASTPLTRAMGKEYFPWYGRFLVPLIKTLQDKIPLHIASGSTLYLTESKRPEGSTGLYVTPGPFAFPEITMPWTHRQGVQILTTLSRLVIPEYRQSFEQTTGAIT